MRIFLLSLGLVLAVLGCTSSTEEENDRLLAKVENRALYLSELEGMFGEAESAADSNRIIDMYVNRWVQEALVLTEAERNLPPDLNIDKMVRDYRASLIQHNYEQTIVEELLDSTITQQELDTFYKKNREQYPLEAPIIRCRLLKVSTPAPELDSLQQLWNLDEGTDLSTLRQYAQQYAAEYVLEDSTWNQVEEVALLLPKGSITVDDISTNSDFQVEKEGFRYFFEVFERKERTEIAPLSYIEEQVRKVILHSRKIKLLEEKRDDLYEIGMRKNKIKIYTD